MLEAALTSCRGTDILLDWVQLFVTCRQMARVGAGRSKNPRRKMTSSRRINSTTLNSFHRGHKSFAVEKIPDLLHPLRLRGLHTRGCGVRIERHCNNRALDQLTADHSGWASTEVDFTWNGSCELEQPLCIFHGVIYAVNAHILQQHLQTP